MQLIEPLDISEALRIDLESYAGGRVTAVPIPSDLGAGDTVITPLGGRRLTPVSCSYDVSIGCYGTDDDEAAKLACSVAGTFGLLSALDTQTQYSDANVTNTPYQDYDPRAPQLARWSFRGTVIASGKRLDLTNY